MEWPAWLLNAWARAAPYVERAKVWQGYEADLTSLTILAVGIAIYTVLVFAFYQSLSNPRPFHLGWGAGRWWGKALSAVESALVFPIMSFLYFGVLTASLFFLAKTDSVYQIFLFSMAIVTSVRLTSFIAPGASADLAKLLPLGLLGVMIVDPAAVTWDTVWGRYLQVPTQLPVLGRFFLLFLVLETGVRIGREVFERARRAIRSRSPGPAAAEEPPAEALDSVHMDEPTTTLTVVERQAPRPPKV